MCKNHKMEIFKKIVRAFSIFILITSISVLFDNKIWEYNILFFSNLINSKYILLALTSSSIIISLVFRLYHGMIMSTHLKDSEDAHKISFFGMTNVAHYPSILNSIGLKARREMIYWNTTIVILLFSAAFIIGKVLAEIT